MMKMIIIYFACFIRYNEEKQSRKGVVIMSSLVKELLHCKLFLGLSSKTIESLLSHITYRIVTVKSNDVLFSPHDLSSMMAIVLSGSFDIQKIFPNGKLLILKRKEKYETLAEQSLMADYCYYPATVCANETSRVFLISKANVLQLLELNHQFSLNFLKIMSDLNLNLTHRISILSLDSIMSKIAGYLIYDYKMNKCTMVSLPFSKKEWAEYMDVSRTSLSRELKKMQDQEIIDFDGRSIKILSLDALEKIVAQ